MSGSGTAAYQDECIVIVRLGGDHVCTLDAILCNLHVYANLVEVFGQHLLVDPVIFNDEDLVALVSYTGRELIVAGLLLLHHLLRTRSVPVGAQVPHFIRVKDDGEP